MKKYYAVAEGKSIGVFSTWIEAEQQIKGYSGAKFKKFENEEDAYNFIDRHKNKAIVDVSLKVYTDGSFNKSKNQYGWGYVFVEEDVIIYKGFGGGNEKNFVESYQIAGETIAVLHALKIAIEQGHKEVEVNYDYEGIEKWATKEWKTKSPIAIYYFKELSELMTKVDVYFNKVKAHSGNEFNDVADKFSKIGAEMQLS